MGAALAAEVPAGLMYALPLQTWRGWADESRRGLRQSLYAEAITRCTN